MDEVNPSELALPAASGLMGIEELMALVADRLRSPKLTTSDFLSLTKLYFTLKDQLKVPRIESGAKRGRPFGAKSRSKEEKLKATVQDLVKTIEEKRKLDGQVETALGLDAQQ